MKKCAIFVFTSLCLIAGPVLAGKQSETKQNERSTLFTKENISKAVGAAAGALLGSQIGSGRGKLVAIAVGTLAGYWVGGKVGEQLNERDRAGIAHTTQQALESGEAQTWRNPDTGVSTRVSVRDAGPADADQYGLPRLEHVPTLELVNEFFVADANVNVRGGPSTEYEVLYRLTEGERVPIIGRVAATDWLFLSDRGAGSGFVYEPLFSRLDISRNAVRDVMGTGETIAVYNAENRECRLITQQVALPDSTTQTHEFKACRQPNGSWMQV